MKRETYSIEQVVTLTGGEASTVTEFGGITHHTLPTDNPDLHLDQYVVVTSYGLIPVRQWKEDENIVDLPQED